jgi:23S rRNA (cytidine2498-2'-O)-methyltransferase
MTAPLKVEKLPGQVFHWPDELAGWGQAEAARWGLPLTSLIEQRLDYTPAQEPSLRWAQNIWKDPHKISFSSITQAASALRSLGALWNNVPGKFFRRAALIQEKLPRVPQKPRPFPHTLPATSMGAWTLLDESTLWASPACTSPFPGGRPLLLENKLDPPSSAYAKLQEALLLFGSLPQPDDNCLDAGSAPGGWSWVLLQLGANVFSVDRAEMDPRLTAHPRLHHRLQDAFTLLPSDFAPLDWLFCDVICYPAKLWDWIRRWLDSGKVKHYVVTLKMQGEPDWATIESFAAVSGSRLVHLFHNKHELTWML